MSQYKDTKPVYSSQEATQLIFTDSERKGEDIDIAKDFFGPCTIDSKSDFEPNEEDIESSGDDKG